jgi:hypothetical protein
MDFTETTVDGAQRLRALERANRVRIARARLKREIAAGELTAAEVILRPGREIEGMPIAGVLLSQRRWGEDRCRGFLAGLGMSEGKTIGSMTERQRIATAAVLTPTKTGTRKRDDMSAWRGR